MRVPNKPCYLENCVVRELCKGMTACISKVDDVQMFTDHKCEF